jgi:hypothetical protein
MSGPLADNPMLVRPDPSVSVENPVWVPPQGPEGNYARVFENVLDTMGDYFDISYANRYDGWILTFPRVSPGFEQIWKPGPPDAYQRLEATLQSMRRRAEVKIDPAPDGGFFVRVTIYKELEDVPRPIRSSANAAFRTETSLGKEYEVIDPSVYEATWIPRGRDTAMEQLVLQRLKKCM